MGIKERREREKHYVKGMIMKVVNQMVSEEGWSGVTIRKIAAEIEYSPPIIYEYYDSKEALLLELTKEALQSLLEMIDREVEGVAEPMELLKRIACCYYDFSIANRGYAKTLFGLDGVPCSVHLEMSEWKELVALIRGEVAKLLASEVYENREIEEVLHYFLWLLRGAISSAIVRIHMEDKDPPYNDHHLTKKMIVEAVEALFTGLLKRVTH